MRKRFDDAITECGEIIGLDVANITAHEARVARWINDTREAISELPYNFLALQSVVQLRTYTFVTAGTIAVSSNGVEVTGSSTNFDGDLDKPWNRWWLSISSSGGSTMYRIANVVSDTICELEVPFANTATGSVSGLSYIISQLYYPVPYAFRTITLAREGLGSNEVGYRDPIEFDYYGRSGSFPEVFTIRDTQDTPVETVYTGVSSTANSTILSAEGTFLDDGLQPGDEIRFLTTAFALKRVLSQTSLELLQAPITTTGDTTATARTGNRHLIQFSPNIDQNNVITLIGYRKVFPLSNDRDLIEDGWWDAVRAGVIVKGYEFLKRPSGEKVALYNEALKKLIRNQKLSFSRIPRLKPLIGNRYSGKF